MESEDEMGLSTGTTELLFRTQSQLPSERRRLRERYLELMEDAQKEKENEEFNTNIVIQNMDQADTLFKEVCRTTEAMYDAKLLNIHGEIAKKKAQAIQAGSPFNSGNFLRKLAIELTGRLTDSDVVELDQDAWLNLGNKVYKFFNRVPKLNFIQGTFSEPVEIVRQQRRAREKDVKTKTSEPKVVDANSQKANTDKTFEEIQRIKKVLYNLYKQKGVPICYFHFTVDPDSFSRTIENMFHLAFLVKEREVHLTMDSNELPVIEPVMPGGASTRSETSQSVLTMSVEKWKQIIQVFEIKEAAIPSSNCYRHGVK